MKKTMLGAAAVAILTVAGISTSEAFNPMSFAPSLSGSYSKHSSNRTTQKSGRDSQHFGGKNSAGRDRVENKQKYDNSQRLGSNASLNSNNRTTLNQNDNRSWSDSRNMSDNRATTTIDSRNMSDNRQTTTIDSRDMSDRRISMDNRVDNQRHQSHNYGDGSIVINGEGYKPRVGHENASVGQQSGSYNYIDNSVSGNFGIGHTTVKP